jgi:hypothetical protein
MDAEAYQAGYDMIQGLLALTWIVWVIAGPIFVIVLIAYVLGFFAQSGEGGRAGDGDA